MTTLLEFFLNAMTCPIMLLDFFESKWARWMVIVPLFLLSCITFMIFAIPLLLTSVISSIVDLVNDDF